MSFFEALWASLSCWIQWLGQTGKWAVIEGAEGILDALAFAANLILGLLPTFALDAPNLDGGPVGILNYVVPINIILSGFSGLMLAWIIYRVYQWALKWAKVAD